MNLHGCGRAVFRALKLRWNGLPHSVRRHTPGGTRGSGTGRYGTGGCCEELEPRLLLTITAEEQLFVYLLNRARHDPQQYADDVNLPVNLDYVAARPPLAVNDSLFASAGFHAEEMAEFNYFDHQSQVTLDWPNQMADDFGYDLPAYFDLDNNYIESIAAGNLYGNPADVIELLIIDEGVPSLGHRNHLLGIGDFYSQATEIGVGHGYDLSSLYDHYWAAHITFSDPADTFLTGVVYQDSNLNGRYDLNEGLPGVSVGLGGVGMQTQTNAAGGWSIKVPGAGTYAVSVTGGAFSGQATSEVTVASVNRAVDFISGQTSGIIDFAEVPTLPNQPPVNVLPLGPLQLEEDVPFAITGVSISDPDAGNLSVRLTLSVEHGRLQIATDVADGVNSGHVAGNNSASVTITAPLSRINSTLASLVGLTYTSDLNYSGTDSLVILTSDQGNLGTGGVLTDLDSLALVINPVNDAPQNVFASSNFTAITEVATPLTGISVTDVDLGANAGQVTLAVQQGTLTLRTDVVGGVTSGEVTGNGTSQITITAAYAAVRATLAANSGLYYLSENAYLGDDTLTVTSSDLGFTGVGGMLTDQDSLAIQVTSAPVPPVLSIPGGTLALQVAKFQKIGSGWQIADADTTNFSGGEIEVQIVAGLQATDVLTLSKAGRKSARLSLRRSEIRIGKDVIGRVTGGTNGEPLVIQFTSDVSLGDVETVMANVTLRASRKKLLPGLRTVQIIATDPNGGTSPPQSREINVG